MVRYYGWYSNKMRGQRRKRAEEAKEKAAWKSAATAEQGCGAKGNAEIEIIEHLALKPRRIPSRSWRELIKHDQTSRLRAWTAAMWKDDACAHARTEAGIYHLG